MKAFKTFFTILKEALLTLTVLVGFPIAVILATALIIIDIVIILPIETAIELNKGDSYSEEYCDNIVEFFESLIDFCSNMF